MAAPQPRTRRSTSHLVCRTSRTAARGSIGRKLLIGLPLTVASYNINDDPPSVDWFTVLGVVACYWLFAIAIVICHWGGRICDHWSPGSPPWRARSCRHECARSPWRGTHTSVSFGAVPLCEMEKGGEINSWSLTTWCSICKAKFCYLGFEKLALVFSNFSNIQILVHPSKLK